MAPKKVIKQRKKARAKIAQIKVPRKIDNGSLDHYKHDNQHNNESQDSQSNVETNLNDIENLNIG